MCTNYEHGQSYSSRYLCTRALQTESHGSLRLPSWTSCCHHCGENLWWPLYLEYDSSLDDQSLLPSLPPLQCWTDPKFRVKVWPAGFHGWKGLQKFTDFEKPTDSEGHQLQYQTCFWLTSFNSSELGKIYSIINMTWTIMSLVVLNMAQIKSCQSSPPTWHWHPHLLHILWKVAKRGQCFDLGVGWNEGKGSQHNTLAWSTPDISEKQKTFFLHEKSLNHTKLLKSWRKHADKRLNWSTKFTNGMRFSGESKEARLIRATKSNWLSTISPLISKLIKPGLRKRNNCTSVGPLEASVWSRPKRSAAAWSRCSERIFCVILVP